MRRPTQKKHRPRRVAGLRRPLIRQIIGGSKKYSLQDVKIELSFDPPPGLRLHIFEAGARKFRSDLISLLREKNREVGPRFTKDPEIREFIREATYGLLKEFSDSKGLRVLLAARERVGHPARGPVDINWHPYKVGLHALFGGVEADTKRLTPKIRQTWGDTMLYAHEYAVPSDRLSEFLQFLREKPIQYDELKEALAEDFLCGGWKGVAGINVCDGCNRYGCLKIEQFWGPRTRFARSDQK